MYIQLLNTMLYCSLIYWPKSVYWILVKRITQNNRITKHVVNIALATYLDAKHLLNIW